MSLKEKDSLDPMLQKEKSSVTYSGDYSTAGYSQPHYTTNGLTYTDTNMVDDKLVEKIEVLIKVLGTMIIMPEYETGEDFVKRHVGGVQRPILEGENRDTAIKVMSELISQL